MGLGESVLYILGGVAIFLFGIDLMGDGLKKLAGNRLRTIIEKTTSTPLTGIITGVLLTILLQSSSGTTVLVIGLVSAGLMNLKQAVGLMFGANIGTTVTSVIIGLPISDYGLLMIFIGVVLYLFFTKKFTKNLGAVLFGFGLIFFGLDTMEVGLVPFVQTDFIEEMFYLFSNTSNHFFWLFGVIFGTLFTAAVQSSSAAIGIIQKLYHLNESVATFSLIGALPMILGANIGTTVTGLLASLNGSIESKRVSMVHILFNLFGSILFLIFLWPYYHAVKWIELRFFEPYSMATLAFAHVLMNIVTTVILFFFIDYLIKIAVRIIKEPKYNDELESIIDESYLQGSPTLALSYVKKGLNQMGSIAKSYLELVKAYSFENSGDAEDKSDKLEKKLDDYDKRLHDYMIKLVRDNQLSQRDSNRLSRDLDTIRDFERIGDHLNNLVGFFLERYNDNQRLTEGGKEDLIWFFDKLEYMFDLTLDAFEHNDVNKAKLVIEYEDLIDKIEEKCRLNYIERLKSGEAAFTTKTNYVEILSNLERIADHLSNIAENVINPMRVSRLDVEKVKSQIRERN